jgi:hypothetical protein
VFAGCYHHCGRRFNDAVDDYCALLGLPAGLVENVSDGTNAFLVALERDRGLLVSEAEIRSTGKQQNRISDVFLIRSGPVRRRPRGAGAALSREECAKWLEDRSVSCIPLNRRLRERIGLGRSDHLRAWNAALELIPSVPDEGPQQGDSRRT